jgi:hypothetical protein
MANNPRDARNQGKKGAPPSYSDSDYLNEWRRGRNHARLANFVETSMKSAVDSLQPRPMQPPPIPPRGMSAEASPGYDGGSSYGSGAKSGGLLKALFVLLLIFGGYALVHSIGEKKPPTAPIQAPSQAQRITALAEALKTHNSAPSSPTAGHSAQTTPSYPHNYLADTVSNGRNDWALPSSAQTSSPPANASSANAQPANAPNSVNRDSQVSTQVCYDYATRLEEEWKQQNGAVSAQDTSATLLMCRRSALVDADPISMDMLGVIYERGIGVPQDSQEAISWYRAASQSGNAPAAETAQRSLQRLGAQ